MVGLAGRERKRASQADLERVLQLLELTEVAERPAGELSQGRRQLVSIARALVGDPRVVLLDEPASGLDTAESQWLGERLRRSATAASRSCWSTTTCTSCSTCASRSTCSTSAADRERHARGREGRPPCRRGVPGQHPCRAGDGDRMNERVDQATGFTGGAALRVPRRSRPATGTSTSSGRSISRPTPGPSSPSSARTARARPRCSRRWADCCRARAARCASRATSSRAGAPLRRHEPASCSCPTTGRCSRR